MSKANSGMTLHSLVLSSDSFSLHCNSIQSPVSIVHLRVILTYLIPLLQVYINQHSSNAIQFSSNLYSNATTSTRINILQCTYVHLCLFHSKLHSPLRVILQGFVTPNATWCQNRGCICISSVRRTYGRIHILPAYIQSSRQVQLSCGQNYFQRRGERRSKERFFNLSSSTEYSGVSTFLQELQDFFEYSVFYSVSTRNPATPRYSTYRINSSPRNTTTTRLIPCRLIQGIFQQLFPCLQAFYTAE